MKLAVALFSVIIALSAIISPSAQAFGQLGHRIIGELAQNNLSPAAEKRINTLTKGESLAKISTWADEIRSDKNWSHAAPWHYVSFEDNETWETIKRNPAGDIIESLERFEKVLKDHKATTQDKWQALAFYVHFVGDIHQPLHVGHSHDLGGNNVKVKWFGKDTNLHSVWDSKMIGHKKLNYAEYTQFISHISAEDRNSWEGKSYYQWADESKTLRKATYKLEKNDNGQVDLRFKYISDHILSINLRLQQAGIRLANKLNAIFTQ